MAGRSLMLDRSLTPSDHDALLRRRNELATHCAPTGKDPAIKALSQIFLAFPSYRQSEDDRLGAVTLMLHHVQNFPLWAIRKACHAATSKNSAWPPSAGEFRALVEIEVRAFDDERAAIDRILEAAKNQPAETIKQAAERLRDPRAFAADTISELRRAIPDNEKLRDIPGVDKDRGKTKDQLRAEAEEWLASGAASAPLPKMSPALRKVCGVTNAESV